MSQESPIHEAFAWENNASQAGNKNKKKKMKKSFASSFFLCVGL